jgi:iron-sulfur cluster repair protein YtfE (RIC family)
MNILHALLGEHGILKVQIEAMRSLARKGGTDLPAMARGFAEAVESHALLEDELLFEPLATDPRMPAGPIAAMRAEHAAIEGLLARVTAPPDPVAAEGDLSRAWLVERLCETLLHHFAHEEHVLFVLASRIADATALEELGARWAGRRAVEIGPALAGRPA